jgi:hypothetical protein
MSMTGPCLYQCSATTAWDIQALAEFLRGPAKPEGALHRLLEQHTGVIGALGFSQFLSEFPLIKRNELEVLTEKRRRDRADILAAQESELVEPLGIQLNLAHIIELKKAHEPILDRADGLRLSDVANQALQQLSNYHEWLTTVEDNRKALEAFGWKVFHPAKYLVMGRDKEFVGRPGLKEGLKEIVLQQHGTRILTVEDLLRLADQARSLQRASMQGIANLKSTELGVPPLILAASGIAGLVLRFRNLLGARKNTYGNIVVRGGVPDGLVHISGKRLQSLAKRTGVPFAEAVVDFAQFRGPFGKMWRAEKDGIVVALPDVEIIKAEIKAREVRNVPRHRGIAMSFARKLRERFPSMPAGEEIEIANRATEPESGRVGRSHTVEDPVGLAVAAHVRWKYTNYAEVLDDVHQEYREISRREREYLPPPAEKAQRAVEKKVKTLLRQWSQPAHEN